MPRPIQVGDARVPESALEWRAVRSSGPGGQNVNKVASKVELRVDLARIQGLSEGARARLEHLTERRRDASGRLLVTSQLTREQARNLDDALAKVRALIARAQVEPRGRRPTAPTRAARAKRLDEKRRAGAKKQMRGRPQEEE
jgi:ribosome-associated protein